jgi:modulator of FtsH protease HflC
MAMRALPIAIAAVIALVLASFCVFTVKETEIAIRKQMGQIVATNYPAGLHLKWPWPIDEVVKFERRIVTQSYPGETFLTNENRGLIVDFYLKWRVKDATAYYNATEGNEELAADRLGSIVKDGIKSVVAQRTLGEIVSAERAAVTGQMFGRASKSIEELGAELIDVRVQRIDLPEDVSTRVYESMKQNFAKLASRLRAEGMRSSVTIRAAADRKRTEIIANAQRDSLQLRGEGDSKAADIYAHAYAQNPEFYAFYRSLQAYQNSLGKDGDVLVLTPDGEFFKYFKNPSANKR